VIRGLMTDQEWAIFAPFLISPSSLGGRPPKNHRKVLDGVFWISRTGAPWRDLPEVLGNWNSVHKQFRRWCQSRRVGRAVAGTSGQRRRCRRVADDRQHHGPGTSLRCRRKRGAQDQALGRSRGGFTTKIHLRCNAEGLAIGAALSEGEAHDVTAYEELMEQRDSDPGAMLADKGYDSDAIRQDLHDRGAAPEIPTKRNRKVQYLVSRPLYALRSRIECFIGHLKEQRRVATRYDKTASSFLGFVLLGCARIWIRFVHRA
jgi:transposase